MKAIKKFFGITEKNYKFEIFDVTAIITVINVLFVVLGWKYAPIFGLINCVIFFALNAKNHAHINNWLTQIALIILNCYFLTL